MMDCPIPGLKAARGLTLIELLIVIGIIALLAAVVVPFTTRAGASALRAKCLNNLRQVGMALRAYTEQNSYHLPHCTRLPSSPPLGEGSYPGIAEVLRPFLNGGEKVLGCPADTKGFLRREGTSYEWNSLLNGKAVGQEKLEILGVSIEVPLLSDYEKFHQNAGPPGRNYLYADGSVVSELRK